ncbi:MAG: ferrous iron transporter B, partial [Methylococcales bacterium]|nr:ferrous iron transporter B [Methylococcales bacterium]
RLIDLPGIRNLYAEREDEKVTSSVLLQISHEDHPDMVLVVVDVTQLRRGLVDCTQVMDLGFPVILALNMIDLAEKKGITIRTEILEKFLEIPVIGISAAKRKGLKELKSMLPSGARSRPAPVMQLPTGFHAGISLLQKEQPELSAYAAWQALLKPELFPDLDLTLLGEAAEKAGIKENQADQLVANELVVRMDRVGAWLEEMEESKEVGLASEKFTDKLDKILLHRIWGFVIFLAILMLIFQSIFAWSEAPMGWIESGMSALQEAVKLWLPAGWLSSLVADGVIAGVGGIVIFAPQIAMLFLYITLMEESGYMSRVVFLMDRLMRPFGFSGKSIIPLMGGMACAIP